MPKNEPLKPLFGCSVDPSAADSQEPFRQAKAADDGRLDLITLMDHPYNRKLFDTWTLLTALGMATEHVHLGTNVLSTPLRPPAMLAKMAATLDVLTGGRLELGIGAGAYWEGIEAFGGTKRSPGQAVDAFEDTLHILRGMWENAGGSFSYPGKIHSIRGARPGPAPAHPIRLWTGAYGARMLRLTGRLADGVLVSAPYLPPDRLAAFHEKIDKGARQANRSPAEIRRGYNLMGILDLGQPGPPLDNPKPAHIVGGPQVWIDTLLALYQDQRIDTFIFWPSSGDPVLQIEAFAQEVVPAVKAAIQESEP